MRKIVLPLIAAGALLVSFTPAAAQYYPGQPFGAAFYDGDHGGWGAVPRFAKRIDHIRRQIALLNRRDAIGGHAADRLMHEANQIDRRLRDKARYGLDPREAGDIQYRIQQLEQRVQWAVQNRRDHW